MHTYARAEDEISKGLFPRDLHRGNKTYKLKRSILLKATIQHFRYLKRTMRECGNVWKLLFRFISVSGSRAMRPNICRTENYEFYMEFGISNKYVKLRGCLHDTGTSFILVRVHPGSYLSLCICLHDTGEKSHTSTTRTGMRFYM